MGKIKISFGYCKYCKKEIESPIKMPLDSMQKTIWVVIIIATIGLAAIALWIYRKYIARKIFCPYCLSKLEISEKPHKTKTISTTPQSTPQTKRAEVLEKAEELKEDQEEKEKKKIYCPFCGEQLSKKIATCPYCKTAIKF